MNMQDPFEFIPADPKLRTIEDPDFIEFHAHALEALLFCTLDCDTDSEFDTEELHQSVIDLFKAECFAFWHHACCFLSDSEYKRDMNGNSIQALAGHDFALTVQETGAGFSDGDWSDSTGDMLEARARSFQRLELYRGDDGLVYAC